MWRRGWAVVVALALLPVGVTPAISSTVVLRAQSNTASRSKVIREANFPIDEPFGSSTTNDPHWKITGSARLTNEGTGWLRLTPATTNQAGAAILDDPFSSADGVNTEFTYAVHGGQTFDGKYGDGFSVFFFDGSKTSGVGANGGSLGYSCGGTRCGTPGVTGAYVGLGFDVFGNFSTAQAGADGTAASPDTMVIRGSGTGSTGYRRVTSAKVPGGIRADRSNARRVRIFINAGRLTIDVHESTIWHRLLDNYDLRAATGQAALPPTLKIGFAASTGAATEVHEIKDLIISKPTDVGLAKSGPATAKPGDKVTYTLTATNKGLNTASDVDIKDTVPADITGVSYTCAGEQDATCGAGSSGKGNAIDGKVAIPVGGKITITVTGTVSPDTPKTTLVNKAEAVVNRELDTNTDDNAAQVSTQIPAVTDLKIDATASPAGPLPPGAAFDADVKVTNLGPATTVDPSTVTIDLGTGVTAGTPPTGCKAAAGGKLTCTIPAGLAKNGTATFKIPARIPADAPLDTQLPDGTATVANPADPNPANDTAAIRMKTTAKASSDLSVKVAAPTAELAPGEKFTAKVTVTNHGPSDTGSASTVTITLPSHTELDPGAALPAGCTGSGTTLTCTIAAGLKASASADFVIPVRVASHAPLGSTLSGGSATVANPDDPNPGNNKASWEVKTGATHTSDLSIAASVAGKIPPGGTGTVRVTVHNGGPADTREDASVTITLPAKVSPVSPTIPGCRVAGSTTLLCTIPAGLKDGADVSFDIPVKVDPSAPANTTLNGGRAEVVYKHDPYAPNNTTTFGVPTGAGAADLGITAAVSPATALPPGSAAKLTVKVTNHGPSNAGLPSTVTVTLPDHVAVDGSPPAGCTAAAGTTITCTIPAGLSAGADAVFEIPVKIDPAAPTGTALTGGTATVANDEDDNPANNEASFTLATTAKPVNDLAVRVAAPTAELTPGDAVKADVIVTNHGPSDTRSAATVTIGLPAHTALDPATALPDGCAVSGQAVICTIAAGLVAGGDTKFQIPVRVASTAPTSATLTGGSAKVEITDDPKPANNTATWELKTGAKAPSDLSVAATAPGPLPPGGTGTVTVTVHNHGPANTRGESTVTVTLPARVSPASPLPAGCRVTGRLVVCAIPAGLADGAEKAFDIHVKIDPDAPTGTTLMGGSAKVAYADDPNEQNNVAGFEMKTTDKASSDLAIAASVNPDRPLPPGSAAKVTVTVSNHGPSVTASDSTVTVTLPDHVSAGTPLPSGCTGTGQTVTCTAGAGLGVGADKAFEIPVRIDPAAPTSTVLTGGKAVVANPDDDNPANDTATFTLSTTAEAENDLAISVTPPDGAYPGGTADIAVTVRNNGPSTTTSGSTTTITLPEKVSVVGALPAGCSAAGRTITCAIGAGFAAGAETVFTIPVQIDPGAANGATLTGGTAEVANAQDKNPHNNTAHYSIKLGTPDIEFKKTSNPAAGIVVSGDEVTYTINVKNHTGADRKGYTWTDDLSGVLGHADFVSADPSLVFDSGRQTITWTGDLAAHGTLVVSYRIRIKDDIPDAQAGAKLVNVVTGPGSNCPADSANPNCRTDRLVIGRSDLTVTKSVDQMITDPGKPVTYTIQLHNAGTGPVRGLKIADDLSGVLDDAALQQGSIKVEGSTVQPVFAAPKLTWTGDVPEQSTVTITYTVVVNTPDLGDQTMTNVLVSGAGNCFAGSTDPACRTTTRLRISATKQPTGKYIRPHQRLTYTVTLTNNGPTEVTGLAATDDLSGVLDDATYDNDAKATLGGVSYTAPKITWSGDIPPNTTVTITYSVTGMRGHGDGRLRNGLVTNYGIGIRGN